MLNPSNPKEIVFPHHLPYTALGGKMYTWNDVDGGAVPVEKFGYQKKNYMGGRCIRFGFITELGFYGCLDHFDKQHTRLCGFYLHDPSQVTEKGKAVLEQALVKNTISYINFTDLPKQKEDTKKHEALVKKATKLGIPENAVVNAKNQSIESLITAKEFDLSNSDIDEDFLLKEAEKKTRKATAKA